MTDAALIPTTQRHRRLRRSGLLLVAATTAVVLASGPAGAAAPSPVIAGYAGMLDDLVVNGLQPGVAPRIAIDRRSGSSLGVARSIRSGDLPADLYGSADSNVNQILIGDANGNKVRWYAAFARAEIVFAYSPSPTLPRRTLFDAAANGSIPWHQAIEKNPDFPDLKILRSNPNNDPSGYYALFIMQLAERFHHKSGFKQDILGDDLNPAQVGPVVNPALLESGEIDGIFLYKSFAEAFGLKYLSLPPEINLSDPAHADFYATASYFNTTDNTTYRGGVIRPSFAPVEGAANSAAAKEVLRTTVKVAPPKSCRPELLEVLGGGASVVAAVQVQGSRCLITVHAREGAVGTRDLSVKHKTGGDKVVTHTIPGVVHLTDAIPVKPDFLS
ncbi:MAG: substrate-binding domain-containing protein [Pseudonocardiaceae bacterium]